MNFNKFLLLIISLFLVGCGVKSDPRPPSSTILPSIQERFLAPSKTKEETRLSDDPKAKKKPAKNKK